MKNYIVTLGNKIYPIERPTVNPMRNIIIHYKPHIKEKIYATLIDYGIFFFFFFVCLYFFGNEGKDGVISLTGTKGILINLLWVFYFPGTEAINGATPGHDILKLKVVKINGDKINFWDAFKRRLLDVIDIACYGIPAFICIKNTEKCQRLGDLLAGTCVIKWIDIEEIKNDKETKF